MAANIDEDFVRIFRPFRVMSPFSITMASTNRYDQSAMYVTYAILSLVPLTVLGWYHVLVPENLKYIPFNTNGAVLTNWLLIFVLNIYLIFTLGKHRVQKLILEMQKLDKMLSFSDEALVRKMVVHNKIWLVCIIAFPGITALPSALRATDACQIRVLILFVSVDVAMLCEAACTSCLAALVCTRLEHFVLHLNLLLAGNRRDKGADVTLCYRQTHRVLERLVKACQVQMAPVIFFSFYSCLCMFLAFIKTLSTVEKTCLNVVTSSRHIGVFVVLGALGQAARARLAQVRRRALLMEYSPHEKLQSAGRCISEEAAVRPRGVRALGVELSGRLPLLLGGMLAAAVVLLLQLDVHVDFELRSV